MSPSAASAATTSSTTSGPIPRRPRKTLSSCSVRARASSSARATLNARARSFIVVREAMRRYGGPWSCRFGLGVGFGFARFDLDHDAVLVDLDRVRNCDRARVRDDPDGFVDLRLELARPLRVLAQE